jgi:hypothetical protein
MRRIGVRLVDGLRPLLADEDEENTGPEHQLVIIGHEAWHMFQGHGHTGTGGDHAPAASRAAFHCAARTEGHRVREKLEAEHFGFRFATDVRAVLREDRSPGDPHDLAGRIRASMAHRFQR